MLQFKSDIVTKILPNCTIIFSQPTLRVDKGRVGNGKAVLTLHNLNEHFLQLNFDAVDNSKIKVKRIGRKGLYLNPKEKGRLTLNFMHKIRSF